MDFLEECGTASRAARHAAQRVRPLYYVNNEHQQSQTSLNSFGEGGGAE